MVKFLSMKERIIMVKVVDKGLKEKVIKTAKMLGCDLDGDVVNVDGVYYYVHLMNNAVYVTDHNNTSEHKLY